MYGTRILHIEEAAHRVAGRFEMREIEQLP
jgi:hypothetical protein